AGATPPATPDYDQLKVNGTVTLGGQLNVSLINGFLPVAGNTFTIIQNDSTDPVVGTFAGLPEGATFVVGGIRFGITYHGGTGNDVVLSAAYVVINTNDAGAGSLRQAILDANANAEPTAITFNIPTSDG